jgi:hypothetical protein
MTHNEQDAPETPPSPSLSPSPILYFNPLSIPPFPSLVHAREPLAIHLAMSVGSDLARSSAI